MTLRTDLAAGLDDLFADEHFGEPVIYKGVTIQAIVDIGEEAVQPGAVAHQGKIEVRISDVPSPVIYDAVTIRGQAWQVLRPLSSDFMSHVLAVMSNERPKPRKP